MSVDTVQNPLSTPGKPKQRQLPPANVARSIGGMFGDLLSLAELQLKLLKRDSSEAVSRTYVSIAFLLLGVLILLACLPVGMLAIVYSLHQFGEISMAISLLIVVASGLVLGVAIAAFAFFKLKKAGNIFHRSQTELSKNIDWLKNSMDQG